MSAILKDDPPDFASSGIAVPPMLERITRRCLEKDPGARFRSAHDLAFALGAADSGPGPSAPTVAPGARSLGPLWVGLAATTVAAVALGSFVLWRSSTRTEPPSFEQITFRRGTLISARFAPRGDTIVYGAAWEGSPPQVFSTERGHSEARPLGFSPASLLALSSTGEMALSLEPRWIWSAFQPGVLARAPLAGGVARRLLANVNAADWSPDGRDLAVARAVEAGGQIEFPLGRAVYQTKNGIGSLRVSPDGTRLAFIEYDSHARVMILEGHGPVRALSSGWAGRNGGLAWSPSGREVFFTLARTGTDLGALYAVDLEGRERRILRVPGGLWLQDVARDGRVLLAHMRFGLQLRAGETSSSADRDLSWFTSSFVEDMSPDGRQVLFEESWTGDLYLRGVDGSPAVKLSNDSFGAALSPDGSAVALVNLAGQRLSVVSTREGEPAQVATGPVKSYASVTWMPDGRRLIFSATDQEGARVFVQEIAGGLPRPLTPVGFQGQCPSPDGARFATRDPKGEIVLWSLDGRPPLSVPGHHPDRQLLRWSADGRSLFAFRLGDLPSRLYRIDLTTGAEEVVRTFMPPEPAGVWRVFPVVVTPDGRHYAYTATQNLSDLYLYTGLR